MIGHGRGRIVGLGIDHNLYAARAYETAAVELEHAAEKYRRRACQRAADHHVPGEAYKVADLKLRPVLDRENSRIFYIEITGHDDIFGDRNVPVYFIGLDKNIGISARFRNRADKIILIADRMINVEVAPASADHILRAVYRGASGNAHIPLVYDLALHIEIHRIPQVQGEIAVDRQRDACRDDNLLDIAVSQTKLNVFRDRDAFLEDEFPALPAVINAGHGIIFPG